MLCCVALCCVVLCCVVLCCVVLCCVVLCCSVQCNAAHNAQGTMHKAQGTRNAQRTTHNTQHTAHNAQRTTHNAQRTAPHRSATQHNTTQRNTTQHNTKRASSGSGCMVSRCRRSPSRHWVGQRATDVQWQVPRNLLALCCIFPQPWWRTPSKFHGLGMTECVVLVVVLFLELSVRIFDWTFFQAHFIFRGTRRPISIGATAFGCGTSRLTLSNACSSGGLTT